MVGVVGGEQAKEWDQRFRNFLFGGRRRWEWHNVSKESI